jgi:hypothetical protein
VTGPAGLTPHEAANKRKGAPIAIDGRMMKVTDLFQAKAAAADGPAGDRALAGAIQYGFVAAEAGEWLIARWTETQIQFLRGRSIPDTEVIAALGTLPEKAK